MFANKKLLFQTFTIIISAQGASQKSKVKNIKFTGYSWPNGG